MTSTPTPTESSCPSRLAAPIHLDPSATHQLQASDNLPQRAIHVFDTLPWITALDSTADSVSLDPWDIADLSQISVHRSMDGMVSQPLRRRGRGAARSSPVQPKDDCFAADPCDFSRHHSSSPPATPRTCFDPTQVSFHHLMPIFNHDFTTPRH